MDRWFNYLTEEADYDIPAELRYWIFESVMSTTRFDSDENEFHKRRDDTVEQFPELNSEALNAVIQYKKNRKEYGDELKKVDSLLDDLRTYTRINLKKIPDHVDTTEQEEELEEAENNLKEVGFLDEEGKFIIEEELEEGETSEEFVGNKLKQEKNNLKEKFFEGVGLDLDQEDKEVFLNNEESFRKLYEVAYKETASISEEKIQITEGKWKKYDQDSDPSKLVEDIAGKGTGWCITSESTANSYLENGDFYVYFSKDPESEDNEAEIPRIGISTNSKGKIKEIRGTADNGQHLDRPITKTDILDNKLKKFGWRSEKYLKKKKHMKKLTKIEEKQDFNRELNKKELKFLYEMNEDIESFGYGSDPRIKKIRNKRDVNEDIAKIYNEPEIEENLDLKGLDLTKFPKNLKKVGGNLDISDLKSAEDIVLPKTVDGDLYLMSLKSAEGLQLPEHVGGSVYLNSLNSTKDLQLPEHVGGNLHLGSLESAEGLNLSDITVEGRVILYKLNKKQRDNLEEKFSHLKIVTKKPKM